MNRSLIFLLATLSAACTNSGSVNKFSDPDVVKIHDLQDRRSSDSLRQFLQYPNTKLNQEALLAFASVQDTSVIGELSSNLHSSYEELQFAAAFALGQTGGNVGKILNEPLPGILTDAQGYLNLGRFLIEKGKGPPDSADNPGIPWAYYRYGLNSKVADTEAMKVKKFLASADSAARLGAVHFFARSNALNNSSPATQALVQDELIRVSKNDLPEIRMTAVQSLRKIKTDTAFSAIENALSDQDYRVRVNAIRGLLAFPFEKAKDLLYKAVHDKQVNVGIAASEAIMAMDAGKFWVEIANLAGSVKNWRIQADLYHAALKGSKSTSLITEIKTLYQQSLNPYQKAALLVALQESPDSYTFLEEELFKADIPIIRSSAANALVAGNRKSDFSSSLKPHFAALYRKAIQTGDPALIGIATDALGDSVLGYRDVISDVSFLRAAKGKLSLPRDIEMLQSLEAAIAHFEKRKYSPPKNEFGHPINWALVKKIPKDQVAVIKTSRGNITIGLLVEEAPGSVANFVDLVQRNYFDHQHFHRVVPNFVIQGGCNRGDGTGGEDYSIRSEFTPRRYTTGSVGMASSGKDTESTQWFITHSPTPHLDGRYTIFAEVKRGMEVVHQIEVGDEIIDVELPGFNPDEKR